MYKQAVLITSMAKKFICTQQWSNFLSSPNPFSRAVPVATVTNFKIPPNYDHVEFPPGERRRLRLLEKAPQPHPGQKMPKLPKAIINMRGPEPIHNTLLHKQYGIRALQGGSLRWGHYEMMRLGINRKMDESKMFAIWRIDPPWNPKTKKGQGHRMGGGKGAIDRYEHPIKAGRIIVEMGGHIEYEEVYPLLKRIAQKLPFKAEAICYEDLVNEQKLEKYKKEANLNPFNFEYCLKNNFLGSRIWASPFDFEWGGKHK